MKKERYITMDEQCIYVTEEIYQAYKRPAWVERKRRQRRASRERSLEAFLDSGLDIPSNQALVDDLVEDKLLLDVLLTALDELTDDERDLVQSLYYRGMTEREVAQQSGLSQNTVHYHKTRLLTKLRKLIEKKF